jgi:hypothetical protein
MPGACALLLLLLLSALFFSFQFSVLLSYCVVVASLVFAMARRQRHPPSLANFTGLWPQRYCITSMS